jgi:hypothetical protein
MAVSFWYQIAKREGNEGKMIVTIFLSGGERYMNSDSLHLLRRNVTT